MVVCQFCQVITGFFLVFGAHDEWACADCIRDLGLEEHELLGYEYAYVDPDAAGFRREDGVYSNFEAVGRTRSVVTIEEIPYSGLADLAKVTAFKREHLKKKGKWTVKIVG